MPAPAALLGCPSAEQLLLLQMNCLYQAPVKVVTEGTASQKSCVNGVQSTERGKLAPSHSLGYGQSSSSRGLLQGTQPLSPDSLMLMNQWIQLYLCVS